MSSVSRTRIVQTTRRVREAIVVGTEGRLDRTSLSWEPCVAGSALEGLPLPFLEC